MNTAMYEARKVLGSDIFWDAVSVAKEAHPTWIMDKIAKMQNGDEIDRAHVAVLKFFRPELAPKAPGIFSKAYAKVCEDIRDLTRLRHAYSEENDPTPAPATAREACKDPEARRDMRTKIVARLIEDNYSNSGASNDLRYMFENGKIAVLNSSQTRVNGYGSAKFEGWDNPSPLLLKLVIEGYKVFVQTSRTVDEIVGERDYKWRAFVPTSRIYCRLADSSDVFNDDGEKVYDPRNKPWEEMFQVLNWAPPSRPDLGPNAWRLKASAYGALIGTIEQVTALGLKMEDCGSYIPKPKIDPTTQVTFDIWNFVGGFRVKVHCRSVLVLEAMERSIRAEPKPPFAYAEKLAIRVDLDSIKIDSAVLSFDVFSDPSFRSKEFREFVRKLDARDSVTLEISELLREDDDWTVIVEFKMSPSQLAKDIEGKPVL